MVLKDSGARRKFDTGAVRDIADGKGRCDLLPQYEVAKMFSSDPENNMVEANINLILRLFDKYVDNYKNKNSWIKIPMSFYFTLFFISYTQFTKNIKR